MPNAETKKNSFTRSIVNCLKVREGAISKNSRERAKASTSTRHWWKNVIWREFLSRVWKGIKLTRQTTSWASGEPTAVRGINDQDMWWWMTTSAIYILNTKTRVLRYRISLFSFCGGEEAGETGRLSTCWWVWWMKKWREFRSKWLSA